MLHTRNIKAYGWIEFSCRTRDPWSRVTEKYFMDSVYWMGGLNKISSASTIQMIDNFSIWNFEFQLSAVRSKGSSSWNFLIATYWKILVKKIFGCGFQCCFMVSFKDYTKELSIQFSSSFKMQCSQLSIKWLLVNS